MEDNRPYFVKREDVFANEDYKKWLCWYLSQM